jgi:SPP1 gp7 family putative phage head morphogenesis protein
MNPAEAQAWAEAALSEAFSGALGAQESRLLDLLRTTQGQPTMAQMDAFWRRENDALWRAVQPTLETVAQERAIVASLTGTADDAMWNVINDSVIGWVNDYYTNADLEVVGSIPNLIVRERTEFARAFLDWQRGELETAGYADGLPQLIRALEPTFGRVRAERIAVTETTRIFYESTWQAANANPNVTMLRWYTAADERVCPVCGPLHLAVIPKAQRTWQGGIGMPAHPNCRCVAIEETALTMETPMIAEEQWSYEAQQAGAFA